MQLKVNAKGIYIVKTLFQIKEIKVNQLQSCAVYIISCMPCSHVRTVTERETEYTSFLAFYSHPSNLANFCLNFQHLHLLDPSTWNNLLKVWLGLHF
jgi:hypothetical protein